MPFFLFSNAGVRPAALLAAVLVLAACAPMAQRATLDREPSIRVCVADRISTITVAIDSGAVLQSSGQRFSLDGHRELQCALNAAGDIAISMDGKPARVVSGAFRCFYPKGTGSFRTETRSYSDTMLIASDGEHLYLINILPLERYLEQVVPSEIGRNRTREELEAVKAQAVIARSYALGKIRQPSLRLFDVYADTRDQVFGDRSAADVVVNEALRATRGVVLAIDGRTVEAFFHSTCGGRTEAVENVWKGSQPRPWLRGGADVHAEQEACRISPSFRWTEEYTREQMETLLRTWLPSADEALTAADIPDQQWFLLDINVLRRSASGRVTTVQIVMGNRLQQRSYYVHHDAIRRALRRSDGAVLRSTLFDVHLERDASKWLTRIVLRGGGSGHGVGMCQWGAIARARHGERMEEILDVYFPECGLVSMY